MCEMLLFLLLFDFLIFTSRGKRENEVLLLNVLRGRRTMRCSQLGCPQPCHERLQPADAIEIFVKAPGLSEEVYMFVCIYMCVWGVNSYSVLPLALSFFVLVLILFLSFRFVFPFFPKKVLKIAAQALDRADDALLSCSIQPLVRTLGRTAAPESSVLFATLKARVMKSPVVCMDLYWTLVNRKLEDATPEGAVFDHYFNMLLIHLAAASSTAALPHPLQLSRSYQLHHQLRRVLGSAFTDADLRGWPTHPSLLPVDALFAVSALDKAGLTREDSQTWRCTLQGSVCAEQQQIQLQRQQFQQRQQQMQQQRRVSKLSSNGTSASGRGHSFNNAPSSVAVAAAYDADDAYDDDNDADLLGSNDLPDISGNNNNNNNKNIFNDNIDDDDEDNESRFVVDDRRWDVSAIRVGNRPSRSVRLGDVTRRCVTFHLRDTRVDEVVSRVLQLMAQHLRTARPDISFRVPRVQAVGSKDGYATRVETALTSSTTLQTLMEKHQPANGVEKYLAEETTNGATSERIFRASYATYSVATFVLVRWIFSKIVVLKKIHLFFFFFSASFSNHLHCLFVVPFAGPRCAAQRRAVSAQNACMHVHALERNVLPRAQIPSPPSDDETAGGQARRVSRGCSQCVHDFQAACARVCADSGRASECKVS